MARYQNYSKLSTPKAARGQEPLAIAMDAARAASIPSFLMARRS
jgi:hypothetical protein